MQVYSCHAFSQAPTQAHANTFAQFRPPRTHPRTPTEAHAFARSRTSSRTTHVRCDN